MHGFLIGVGAASAHHGQQSSDRGGRVFGPIRVLLIGLRAEGRYQHPTRSFRGMSRTAFAQNRFLRLRHRSDISQRALSAQLSSGKAVALPDNTFATIALGSALQAISNGIASANSYPGRADGQRSVHGCSPAETLSE
jgi:hypothetical protein